MSDRLFLAVALDDDTRHAIATYIESSLDGDYMPGRPVPPENWHITLRFLGETSAAQSDQILAHLDQHLMVEPFRIRSGELGGFPKQSKASVLWLGVTGAVESLAAVADECETAAQRAGFEPEGRPFHAHLTLSRIRPPLDIRDMVEQFPAAKIRLDVSEVTLLRSNLNQRPVRYDVVDRISLL